MSLFKGFHHVSLKAYEFDKVVDFYTKVLDCKIVMQSMLGKDRGVILDTGNGSFIEIFDNGTPEPKPEGTIHHFAFLVEDVDKAVEKIEQAGGTVVLKPMNMPAQTTPPREQIRVGFIKGPMNELIELYYEK